MSMFRAGESVAGCEVVAHVEPSRVLLRCPCEATFHVGTYALESAIRQTRFLQIFCPGCIQIHEQTPYRVKSEEVPKANAVRRGGAENVKLEESPSDRTKFGIQLFKAGLTVGQVARHARIQVHSNTVDKWYWKWFIGPLYFRLVARIKELGLETNFPEMLHAPYVKAAGIAHPAIQPVLQGGDRQEGQGPEDREAVLDPSGPGPGAPGEASP